jgi:hypothetical protein
MFATRPTRSAGAALLAAIVVSACSRNAEPPPATYTPTPVSTPAPQISRASIVIAGDLPPLPFSIVGAAKPEAVLKAAYEFAARHPEILQYMPCFCGCQRGGHRSNHDCFVERRDAAGKVAIWSPHGVGCEVCLDVAYSASQMHRAGASASAIREAVDKRYADATTRTPTPLPKKGNDHDH